ncbi:hypothetical protein C8R45DRAFT_932748 [Mycena sanguinolenta]|nr:hypothetical protein C8R45DRAFT_932748 [Mycena sanguinolenta]
MPKNRMRLMRLWRNLSNTTKPNDVGPWQVLRTICPNFSPKNRGCPVDADDRRKHLNFSEETCCASTATDINPTPFCLEPSLILNHHLLNSRLLVLFFAFHGRLWFSKQIPTSGKSYQLLDLFPSHFKNPAEKLQLKTRMAKGTSLIIATSLSLANKFPLPDNQRTQLYGNSTVLTGSRLCLRKLAKTLVIPPSARFDSIVLSVTCFQSNKSKFSALLLESCDEFENSLSHTDSESELSFAALISFIPLGTLKTERKRNL